MPIIISFAGGIRVVKRCKLSLVLGVCVQHGRFLSINVNNYNLYNINVINNIVI